MLSMDTAPQDGSTINLLVDEEWLECHWSERADDGSPYGVEGWQDSESGYVVLDAQAWHPIETKRYTDGSPLQGHQLKQPIVVLGLAFGDEAKGATTDFLSSSIPDAAAVVRWSGGGNAAHNVRHGHRHHTFRQFGAGSFLGLPTFLNQNVTLNLTLLMAEAVELENEGVHNPLSLIVLHGDSLITTPVHIALNRAREILRGIDRHGSCGLGIGETRAHAHADRNMSPIGSTVGNFKVPGPTSGGKAVITAGSLLKAVKSSDNTEVIEAIRLQRAYAEPLIEAAIAEYPELAGELSYESDREIAKELLEIAGSVDIFSNADFEAEVLRTMELGTVIFEGSQGVLLDEKWGFHPHTTWAQTEPSSLVNWLVSENHDPYILGLTRSYLTRHGAGPLPSELAVKMEEQQLPSDDNSWGRWQGGFRVAALDLPLLHYSLKVLRESGIILNGLSVSHLDAFEDQVPVVIAYNDDKNPSVHWKPEDNEDPFFPLMNSDSFLEEYIQDKAYLVSNCGVKGLPILLGEFLGLNVALLASGPYRLDRKFSAV